MKEFRKNSLSNTLVLVVTAVSLLQFVNVLYFVDFLHFDISYLNSPSNGGREITVLQMVSVSKA